MSSEDFELAPMTFTGHQGYEEKVAEKFNRLYTLNANDKAQSKNGLRYLSWSSAWAEFKKVYPLATFSIVKNPATNLPYFADPIMGIFVSASVTADGLTYEMTLPVLDSANRSLKTEPYTIQVWDKTKKAYTERIVEACTSFDINRSILRCLTKCIALHGLGLYIYQGEDMPEEAETTDEAPIQQQQTKAKRRNKSNDPYAGIRAAINSTNTTQELTELYRQHENEVKGNPQILALFTTRKQQLLNAA